MNAAATKPGRKRPQKPCMMLAVIELIEAGKIIYDRIYFSDVLLGRYRDYFEIVKSGNDTFNPWLPFFHLRGDPFWHLVALPGKNVVVSSMNTASKRSDIQSNVDYAKLDDELFEHLLSPTERNLLRDTLILHWFPVLITQLKAHIGVTEFELVLQGRPSSKEDILSPVRSSAFRRLVVEAYDFRCVATGWRIIMPDYSVLVEAAQLVPFSETADDRPRNGMTLTPTFHRALDKQLITPGPDLKWHVSQQIDRVPDNQLLLELEGTTVCLPRERRFQPDVEALECRLDHLL